MKQGKVRIMKQGKVRMWWEWLLWQCESATDDRGIGLFLKIAREMGVIR